MCLVLFKRRGDGGAWLSQLDGQLLISGLGVKAPHRASILGMEPTFKKKKGEEMADRFIIIYRPHSLEKSYHLDILLRNSCFSNNRYCIPELTSNRKSKSFTIYLSLFYTIA